LLIAIKNPAPIGPHQMTWGDFHFGASLQAALERLGVSVVQHYWPDWEKSDGEDAIIVLRGKRAFAPREGQFSILWVLSHPATVSVDEIESFDLTYLGSSKHLGMMKDAVKSRLKVLRQCSDDTLFNPGADPAAPRSGTIFVANSRGVLRNMLRWALDAGIEPALYGNQWRSLGLRRLVGQRYIETRELPLLSRRSRLSLNDHWTDMIYFGYINNRIFDCLFCGLPVLSDEFPELREVCGDGILYAGDATSFRASHQYAEDHYDELSARTAELGKRLRPHYTFAARAAEILDDLKRASADLASPRPSRSVPISPASKSAPGKDTPANEAAAIAIEEDKTGATVLDEVLGFFAMGEARIELLHLFPGDLTLNSRESLRRFAYLSAGLGIGPWQIGLTPDLAQIRGRKFDAIVVDALPDTEGGGGSDRRGLLLRLAEKVKSNGIFVVASGVAEGAGLSGSDLQSLEPKGKGRQYHYFAVPAEPG
jgi:hypothetical protein